jgi:hypothetical protein
MIRRRSSPVLSHSRVFRGRRVKRKLRAGRRSPEGLQTHRPEFFGTYVAAACGKGAFASVKSTAAGDERPQLVTGQWFCTGSWYGAHPAGERPRSPVAVSPRLPPIPGYRPRERPATPKHSRARRRCSRGTLGVFLSQGVGLSVEAGAERSRSALCPAPRNETKR